MTSSYFRPPSLWGPREAGHNGQDGTPRTMAEGEDGTGSGCTSTWWSSDYKAHKQGGLQVLATGQQGAEAVDLTGGQGRWVRGAGHKEAAMCRLTCRLHHGQIWWGSDLGRWCQCPGGPRPRGKAKAGALGAPSMELIKHELQSSEAAASGSGGATPTINLGSGLPGC